MFFDLKITVNNGLVLYDKLQERLISTGKLDAGASVLMIDHMKKTGRLKIITSTELVS
jgi:hypothetical protein